MIRRAILLVLLAWPAQDPAPAPAPAWEDRGFPSAETELAGTQLHEGSRAATLAADNSKLVEHSDPGRWDVVGNMVPMDGRLLASTSFDFTEGRMLSPWAYSEESQVLEFDPVEDRWVVLKDIPKSMIFNLRVVNGKLLVPEYYPWTADRVTAYDGKEWSELGKLPGAMLHGMDICAYQGKLLWSGSWRATSVEEALKDPKWYGGYGKVFESADEGKTWKEIYSDPLNGRMQDLVVFKDKVYCNRRGQTLMRWDGKEWKELSIGIATNKGEKAVLGSGLLTVFKDAILAVSSPLYYRYDGDAWQAYMPGFLRLFVDGDTCYGIRDDGHVYSSTDGKKWKKITETGVPKAEYERTCQMGRTLRRGSVAMHHGRLHVGTGATGKFFAAAYRPKGTLVGPARKTEGGTTLTWNARVPEGARLVASVRTARTARELKDAPWRGEYAASPATPDIPKGHAAMQVRFSFEGDGRRSPALRSVAWIP